MTTQAFNASVTESIRNLVDLQNQNAEEPTQEEIDENYYDLHNDGRSDGYGESYAERNA